MIGMYLFLFALFASCLTGGAQDLTLSAARQARLQTLVQTVEKKYSLSTFLDIKINPSFTPHQFSDEAIFACALEKTYTVQDAINFAGTARRTGYAGDIVVAVLPEMGENFMAKLKSFNTTVYTVRTTCEGKPSDMRCKYGPATDVPATLYRYYVYQYLAVKYPKTAYVMVADFRDVLFQTNPFNYKTSDWRPPLFDLTVFQEAHPNRVINRDSHCGSTVQNCYGKEVFRMIGSNTISTSGVVFGSRDAIAAYAFLVSKHYEPKNYRHMDPTNNELCLTFGVDQAFHNYLLYTGTLAEYMSVKVFQQGEGPANTVGGFHGERKILKALLSEWKMLRGEAPYQYIHNWNGELSPVVHQLDRFIHTELLGGYRSHLAVFERL